VVLGSISFSLAEISDAILAMPNSIFVLICRSGLLGGSFDYVAVFITSDSIASDTMVRSYGSI